MIRSRESTKVRSRSKPTTREGAGMPPLCRPATGSAHPAVGHRAGPQGGQLHVVTRLGRVPDAAGAGVDAHVVDVATTLEEDQVTGAARPRADVRGGGVLLGGGAGELLANPAVDPLGQSRAVEAGGTDGAPDVGCALPRGGDVDGPAAGGGGDRSLRGLGGQGGEAGQAG